MTIDEWVEKQGLKQVWLDWVTHFVEYGGHSQEDAEYLARLCMTSLRDLRRTDGQS